MDDDNDALNLESLDSVIKFHARMCNAEGCNGPCNHDGKIITDASFEFDYDDDEDDHDPSDYLDDEDDSMEPAPVPASKPASEAEDDHDPSDYLDDEDDLMEPAPVPASKPASEAVIAEKKQQCIDTINNKLTAFLASLRDAFIERAKTAVIVPGIVQLSREIPDERRNSRGRRSFKVSKRAVQRSNSSKYCSNYRFCHHVL